MVFVVVADVVVDIDVFVAVAVAVAVVMFVAYVCNKPTVYLLVL